MEISGLNNNINSFMRQKAVASNDQAKFEALLQKSMKTQEEESLKDACKEFESYYLEQLFTEMRQTVPKSTLLQAAAGRDIYEDMMYDEYAKEISKGTGTGIADMLYKQLKTK